MARPSPNISLIIGLAIPFLMIILVALSIYVPAIFSPQPQYNFLYVTGDDYWNGRQYVVQSGKLIEREIVYRDNYIPQVARIFIHNVAANENQEISFEDAQKLFLNPNSKSPDGWEVVSGGDSGGFFLFSYSSGDYNSMYLQGHNTSKKLNLQQDSSHYRAHFLGWING